MTYVESTSVGARANDRPRAPRSWRPILAELPRAGPGYHRNRLPRAYRRKHDGCDQFVQAAMLELPTCCSPADIGAAAISAHRSSACVASRFRVLTPM